MTELALGLAASAIGLLLFAFGLFARAPPPGWYAVHFWLGRPVAVSTRSVRIIPGLWRVVYLPNVIGVYTDLYEIDTNEILVSGFRDAATYADFVRLLEAIEKHRRREETKVVPSDEDDAVIKRWYIRRT